MHHLKIVHNGITETVNDQIDLHYQDLILIQEEELFLMVMQH
jgi:hypothetical protein